jgi:hypothetical protein
MRLPDLGQFVNNILKSIKRTFVTKVVDNSPAEKCMGPRIFKARTFLFPP